MHCALDAWSWLNDPPHSSAVQALAAVFATVAAAFAAWFAGGAYCAAKRQLGYLEKQLQDEKARGTALAERLRAEEDIERPRFTATGPTQSKNGCQTIEYVNRGLSTAVDVRVIWAETGAPIYKLERIEHGEKKEINFPVDQPGCKDFMIIFRSQFGSNWRITMSLDPSDNSWKEGAAQARRTYDSFALDLIVSGGVGRDRTDA